MLLIMGAYLDLTRQRSRTSSGGLWRNETTRAAGCAVNDGRRSRDRNERNLGWG